MPKPFRKSYVGNKRNFRKKRYKQKQAYKPKQKKMFMKKRQPFVETKKAKHVVFQDEVLNPLVLASQPNPQYRTWRQKQISPIDQFLFLTRGVGNDRIIGRDVFSKYLKQKIEISLPAGVIPDTTVPVGNTNRPFCRMTQPFQIWIVWGWIKKPFGYRTIPGTNPVETIDVDDVYEEIDNVTQNGDALLGSVQTRGTVDSDFLTFKDKRKNMWTQQKRLLRPRDTPVSVETPKGYLWQHTNSNPAGAIGNRTADFGDVNAYTGYPNVLQTTISWDTQRKMRYDAATATDEFGGFAKDSWMPYSYICIPKQFQDATNKASPAIYRYPVDPNQTATHNFYDLVGEMKCSVNTCHWFTDS